MSEGGKDRRPCPREPRNAFKERVEKAKIVAKEVGEHPEKCPCEPSECRDGDALTRCQLLGWLSVAAKADTEKCTDEDGQRECLAARLIARNREYKRKHESCRHCERESRENVVDRVDVHRLLPRMCRILEERTEEEEEREDFDAAKDHQQTA